MAIDVSVPRPGEDVNKDDLRSNFVAIDAKIGTMPESYAGSPGVVIVVKQDGSGPGLPDGTIDFLGYAVKNFIPNSDEISASVELDENYNGGLWKCTNGSAIVITINAATLPPGFNARFWRRGAGAVSFLFTGGATNTNSNGHSAIAGNKMVEVYLDALGSGEVYFDGGTV